MSRHSRELSKVLQAADGFVPEGAFIAGGALTSVFSNKDIADVDYYFKSEEAFYHAIEDAYDSKWWAVGATDRSVTFTQKSGQIIQLVYFEYFQTAEAVFDAFDFTCCMAAYDIDAKKLVFHDNFLKHVAQRHLSFHEGTRFPFVSLLRTVKYREKGYNIGHGDLLRIALRCHSVKLETWKDLAYAIGGHYGGKALKKELLTEYEAGHEKFSIQGAIDLLKTEGAIVEVQSQAMPGSWEAMIRYLKALKKNPLEEYHQKYEYEEGEWEARKSRGLFW